MKALTRRLTSQPAQQTLTVLQPTRSTTSFTVSTRSAPRSFAVLVLHGISLALRLVIGLCAIAISWSKYEVDQGGHRGLWVLDHIFGHPLVEKLVEYLKDSQWRFLGPAILVVLWWVVRRGYTEESLLVLRGLGIQTSTSSSMYLRPPITRFIPTSSIQDIFIHEAFKGFEVRFYLSVVVKGEEDAVVVFPTLLPGRHILEEVWRGARTCLYEPGVRTKS